MTAEQIKTFIQGGEWESITPEVRPSIATGVIKPFYLTRRFKYHADDTFELEILNYADAFGKLPLTKLAISMPSRPEHKRYILQQMRLTKLRPYTRAFWMC